MVAALRQFIEVLISVKLLDQHRLVKELVGPRFNLAEFKDAEMMEGSEILRVGERRGQTAIAETTRVGRNRWSPPLVDSDWGVLYQTLYDGVDQEVWESTYNTMREAAKNVGIMKVRWRTSLLWKLSVKKS